jgi:thiamine-phosphate pyrophosphorylase
MMRAALPEPCLCLVTDRAVAGKEMVRLVALAVEGGVDLVQLREKDLPGGELLALARQLLEELDGRAELVVNERVDVALLAGAQGVQLGEDALPVAEARAILPPPACIGRSVHSVEGAVEAEQAGADFLVVGTMFATGSHPGAQPAGPGLIREMARRCRVPLLGIGGITPDNLGEVVQAGAAGVAVIRNILGAGDPRQAAMTLKDSLLEAWQSRHEIS